MKLNWKDILERVIWTFVQAFVGAIVITPNLGWKAMLIPAIAAGLSALKNVILDIARQQLAEKETKEEEEAKEDEGDA